MAALEQGRESQTYNIVDDEPLTWRAFVTALADAYQTPPPLGRLDAAIFADTGLASPPAGVGRYSTCGTREPSRMTARGWSSVSVPARLRGVGEQRDDIPDVPAHRPGPLRLLQQRSHRRSRIAESSTLRGIGTTAMPRKVWACVTAPGPRSSCVPCGCWGCAHVDDEGGPSCQSTQGGSSSVSVDA